MARRTCKVDRMGENSSFIFTGYVKTVPVYDFKLVWVSSTSDFQIIFITRFTNKSKITMFYSQNRLDDLEISLIHST